MKRLTVALIAALSSPLVLAAEKPYVGIDYQMGTLEFNNNLDADVTAARIRMGTDVNRYIGVEAQVGAGVDSDTIATIKNNWEVKVESFYALFVKPQINLGDFATVYALAGVSYIDKTVEASNPAVAKLSNTQGFEHSGSFGAGLNFKVYKNVRLNADYIQYSSDYNAVSAGIQIYLP